MAAATTGGPQAGLERLVHHGNSHGWCELRLVLHGKGMEFMLSFEVVN